MGRSRTTVLQATTHQWIGTYAGAGNGDYRGELKRALEATTRYAAALSLPVSQVLIRLDGLYGNAAPVTDVLHAGFGLLARSRDYALLDRPEIKARLACPPDAESTHPESGTYRALYDCPDIPLTPTGPRVRLIVAVHPASSTSASIGKQRDGLVYELFVTQLPAPAFSPQDVLDLYLHRGSFETVLGDEDLEHFNHSSLMDGRGTQQAMYLYKMEVCIPSCSSFTLVQTPCPGSRESSEDIS